MKKSPSHHPLFSKLRTNLVRESEWMRVYQPEPNHRFYESKFLADGLEVSVDDIRGKWPSMTEEERLEFAQAFTAKKPCLPQDEEILDFLMDSDSEHIHMTVAPSLHLHSKKEKVLGFLLAGIQQGRSGSYFQGLELLGDKRAIPELRNRYAQYRDTLPADPNKVRTWDNDWSETMDYLSCCRALLILDGSMEFRKAIEDMERHPDEMVRDKARRYLLEQPY